MREAYDRPLPVRLLSLILILTQLGGCVSWHTQHGATEQRLARRAPDRVRVTVADTHLVVWQPRIANDSLMGTAVRPHGGPREDVPVAVSLGEVQRVETLGFNSGRTIALGLGSLAVVAGMAVFVALGAAISASD